MLEGGAGTQPGGSTTHSGLHEVVDSLGDRRLAPDKDRVRLAGHARESRGAEVAGRADHVVEAHTERAPLKGEKESSARGPERGAGSDQALTR